MLRERLRVRELLIRYLPFTHPYYGKQQCWSSPTPFLRKRELLTYRDFTAPREDRTIGRYRAYLDMNPPLVVDCDRAYAAVDHLGTFNPSYRWSTKLFSALAAVSFFGGFVALLWCPWWTPIIGSIIGYILFKSSKQSCADFVRDIVRQNPTERDRFLAAGIVREEIPTNAIGG